MSGKDKFMNIRRGKIQDLKEITAIEAEFFPVSEAATEESFKGRLTVYPDYFWILEEDGKIVSCTAEFRDSKGNIKGDDYGKDAGDDKYKKAQIAVQGFSTYADKLVEVQDPDQVDAVSGATVSNKEFKEAVWDALEKAKK